jgi:sugar lactone lactonase YvrE
MPCFGGHDLKTMFVTSLTAERDGLHTRGTLISCKVDVPGVAIHRMTEPESLVRSGTL